MSRRIVLASESPRRRCILEQIGIAFAVRPSGYDEGALGGDGEPGAFALTSAARKAQEVARTEPDALVLGFDTVVTLGNSPLGKPRDEHEALEMVLRLAGREHRVLTGVCVIDTSTADLRADIGALTSGETPAKGYAVACEETVVRFGTLSSEQAEAYVQKGESLDKAGAYGIQGYGCLLVESIRGCYYNVVGLPVHRLSRLLAQFGVDLLRDQETTTV